MSEFKTYVEKRKEIEAREVTHRETVTTSDGQVRSICRWSSGTLTCQARSCMSCSNATLKRHGA